MAGTEPHTPDTHDHMGAVARVWADIPWETDPALAYLRGLHDGAALERGRADADADQAVRAALTATRRQTRHHEARAAADFPRQRPGDFPGGRPLPPEHPAGRP